MSFKSVTLLGSSSGRNAGDVARISSITDALDAACGEKLLYEIPTITPAYVHEHYPNVHTKAVSMLPWNLSIKMLALPTFRSIRRTDVILIFIAILCDRALYNPLFNFMSTLYVLLPYAKQRGKRMVFYDVGIGPVKSTKKLALLTHF